MFTAPKIWSPDVDVQLTIERSSDAFLLLSTKAYESEQKLTVDVDLGSLELQFLRFVPMSNVPRPLPTPTQPLKSVYTDFKYETFPLSQTSTDIYLENVNNGQPIPNLYIAAFIQSDKLNGSLELNPFAFDVPQFTAASLFIDGNRVPALEPYCNIGDRKKLSLYRTCMAQLGFDIARNPEAVPITQEEFYQSHHFLVWDLSPGRDGGYEDSLPSTGQVSLQFQMKSPFSTITTQGQTSTKKNFHLMLFHTERRQLEIYPGRALTRGFRELAGMGYDPK